MVDELSALVPLAPELAVVAAALLILVIDTFSREKHGGVAVVVAFIGVLAAFVATAFHLAAGTDVLLFYDTVAVDGFALFSTPRYS